MKHTAFSVIAKCITVISVSFSLPAMAGRPAPVSTPDYLQLTPEQALGARLYQDTNLSLGGNQSCATCHALDPVDLGDGTFVVAPGFVDPDNVRDGSAVSAGSIPPHTGGLNTPSAGYAAFSPFFHWNGDEGLFVGGQFWNGRSPTLADQAAQPFLNPDEMAMPSKWAVVIRLKQDRHYRKAFRRLYGLNLMLIPGWGTPASDQHAPAGVFEIYDKMAHAIGEFEKSRHFNKFNSKYDFWLAAQYDATFPQVQLTAEEAAGLELFNGKAMCSACHLSTETISTVGSVFPPLFTDFTYDNLGAPQNVNIVDRHGQSKPIDPGLGGREDIAAITDGAELGKHKVMSLRNIAITPPYGHNGVFPTLELITHFYNTRDVLGSVPDNNDPGFGVTGWPAPEVPETVNDSELGDLGLSAEEEAALVAFMKTLTDDYPEWGNDPLVPPGTPSPFAYTPFPPMP